MSPLDRAASVQIVPIDLRDSRHTGALLRLVDGYAVEEMGMGRPLERQAKERLIEGLRQSPHYRGLLAWDGDEPVGLMNGFLGFSTFRALPLLNVHDLFVEVSHRGRGIGRQLLEAARQAALREGCCRVTLEVRSDNAAARHLYDDLGFCSGYEADVYAEFLTLSLDEAV